VSTGGGGGAFLGGFDPFFWGKKTISAKQRRENLGFFQAESSAVRSTLGVSYGRNGSRQTSKQGDLDPTQEAGFW